MDKQPYPVVTERFLAPVAPKRMFARGPHGRTPDEIPQPQSGHRLVYFTRGAYVLDMSALPHDSPTVVDASRVTVVDVTTDTEVVVLLTIPSQDATSFTIRVTFLCTVDDAVAVVRAGGNDAEAVLSGYLKAHNRLFEIGLDYAIAEINDVRRKLSAQVRAYVTVVPPEFDGMTAKLASVEVLTPDELAKFQESLRGEKQKYTVDSERQLNEQRLKDQRQHFEQLREADEKRHTQEMEAKKHEFEREQLQHNSNIAADPIEALRLSYVAGDITAKELAGELKELRSQQVSQDREDRLARIELERERDKAKWDAERLDRERQLEWEREDRTNQQKAELRREEWEREDRKFERDQQRHELEAKLEVIREAAKHGHLDSMNLRLDQVINEMLGRTVASRVEAGADDERPVIEPRSDDEDNDELTDNEKVRVEDVH